MAVIATDDFNRADGTLGANWTNTAISSDQASIASNQVSIPTVVYAISYRSAETFPANQYGQIKIISLSTSGGIGASTRTSGSGGSHASYFAQHDNVDALNGSLKLYKLTGTGSFTELRSVSRVHSAGEVLKVVSNGSTHQMFINGVQQGADATNSDIASGKAGLWVNRPGSGSVAILDDWEGGDLTAPGGARYLLVKN